MITLKDKTYTLTETRNYDCGGCAFELDVAACLHTGAQCWLNGGIYKEVRHAEAVSAPAQGSGVGVAG